MKLDNRGFIFVETMLIALIVSFTAIMIINGLNTAIKSNRMSVVRIMAVHIANAHMSEIEEYIERNSAAPSSSYTLLDSDDLIYEDFFGIKGTTEFKISTDINTSILDGMKNSDVTVRVSWNVNGNDDYGSGKDTNYEELTKSIWFK